jgi:hypothetical protein
MDDRVGRVEEDIQLRPRPQPQRRKRDRRDRQPQRRMQRLQMLIAQLLASPAIARPKRAAISSRCNRRTRLSSSSNNPSNNGITASRWPASVRTAAGIVSTIASARL